AVGGFEVIEGNEVRVIDAGDANLAVGRAEGDVAVAEAAGGAELVEATLLGDRSGVTEEAGGKVSDDVLDRLGWGSDGQEAEEGGGDSGEGNPTGDSVR